jgi:hypothetical protein
MPLLRVQLSHPSAQALVQGIEASQLTDCDKIIMIRPHGRPITAQRSPPLDWQGLESPGFPTASHDYVASGALVPVMTRCPPPPAGIYVVRPLSQHRARKVRLVGATLLACFEQATPI